MTRSTVHLSTILLATAALVSGARAAHADDNDARTADLYQHFTYQNVTSFDANDIFSVVHISSGYNPKLHMKNPDPAWIPGWDSLSLTDEVRTAIIQAAINRTWVVKADADYKHYRAAWAAIDQQFRPALEATKTGTYYVRAAALAKLLADVREKAEADKVLYFPDTPQGTVGFVDDIVIAMVELHRDTHREFDLARYLAANKVELGAFLARGRAFSTDAIERELYVGFTQEHGSRDTPKLAMMMGYGHSADAVKWPSRRRADDAKAIAALVATNAAALAVPPRLPAIPSLFGGQSADPADPKLRWVASPGAMGALDNYTPLAITKVTHDGATTAVVAELTYSQSSPYACKDTNQLDTTNSGRTWVQNCKYKTTKTKHTFAVTFAELPDGVELQQGDELAFVGDLEAQKDTKAAISYTFTARALGSIKRGGKTIWQR